MKRVLYSADILMMMTFHLEALPQTSHIRLFFRIARYVSDFALFQGLRHPRIVLVSQLVAGSSDC